MFKKTELLNIHIVLITMNIYTKSLVEFQCRQFLTSPFVVTENIHYSINCEFFYHKTKGLKRFCNHFIGISCLVRDSYKYQIQHQDNWWISNWFYYFLSLLVRTENCREIVWRSSIRALQGISIDWGKFLRWGNRINW